MEDCHQSDLPMTFFSSNDLWLRVPLKVLPLNPFDIATLTATQLPSIKEQMQRPFEFESSTRLRFTLAGTRLYISTDFNRLMD